MNFDQSGLPPIQLVQDAFTFSLNYVKSGYDEMFKDFERQISRAHQANLQMLDEAKRQSNMTDEEYKRERAELENQRRRMVREVESARKFANERLLGELLPVFDSLHAGLKAAGDATNPLREGLELTLRQLLKTAGDNGLVELDPRGETFNPERHQAVTQMPSPDAAPGTVLDVFQKGYVLNERLLRPALVVVASEP